MFLTIEYVIGIKMYAVYDLQWTDSILAYVHNYNEAIEFANKYGYTGIIIKL